MSIFFTSDTHFWHYNIIYMCGRPVFESTIPGFVPGYASREEASRQMNEVLIERWNSKISPLDDVYFLGDLAFCGTQSALNCIRKLNGKLHWIKGNHDSKLVRNEEVTKLFEWVRDYYLLRVHTKNEKTEQQYHQPIVLSHYPILSWDGMQHGSWHLHGHCHGSIDKTWNARGFRKDVGVDTNNLYPYSYEEIAEFMKTREENPVDYHRSK